MSNLGDDINNTLQQPAVAGVIGSLLSLRWVPGDKWWEKFFSFGCGIGTALYLAPAAVAYMEIKSSWGPPAFGFMAGLVGMNLIAKLVDIVKNGDWLALLTALKGKKQ